MKTLSAQLRHVYHLRLKAQLVTLSNRSPHVKGKLPYTLPGKGKVTTIIIITQALSLSSFGPTQFGPAK